MTSSRNGYILNPENSSHERDLNLHCIGWQARKVGMLTSTSCIPPPPPHPSSLAFHWCAYTSLLLLWTLASALQTDFVHRISSPWTSTYRQISKSNGSAFTCQGCVCFTTKPNFTKHKQTPVGYNKTRMSVQQALTMFKDTAETVNR